MPPRCRPPNVTTVKCRASSGMTGAHCDGARKNGSSNNAGPLPSIRYEIPAWLPSATGGRGFSAVYRSKKPVIAAAISALRSAPTSDQPNAS